VQGAFSFSLAMPKETRTKAEQDESDDAAVGRAEGTAEGASDRTETGESNVSRENVQPSRIVSDREVAVEDSCAVLVGVAVVASSADAVVLATNVLESFCASAPHARAAMMTGAATAGRMT
jgi:hypothetical protein